MKEDVNPKMLIAGTISLLCAIIFFGGFAKDLWGGIFDFGKLTGQFPEWLKTSGGTSAKGGFLFALTLVPSVMLALGFVAIFEHYGALVAASKWLSPILKPLMGIPGVCSISLIASTQSTDAGSSTTKFLRNEGKITHKELLIFFRIPIQCRCITDQLFIFLCPVVAGERFIRRIGTGIYRHVSGCDFNFQNNRRKRYAFICEKIC